MGSEIETSVVEDKIESQMPDQCALLIYTVSSCCWHPSSSSFSFPSLFTFSLLPSPPLSSTLSSPTFCFPVALFFSSSSLLLFLFRLPSLLPPLLSLALPPYWCIAWDHWWPKRSYAQPWQCKFQFLQCAKEIILTLNRFTCLHHTCMIVLLLLFVLGHL